MKTNRSLLPAALCGLALACAPLSAQPFAGSDDFNGGASALWGYDFRLTGTTGLLDFTNSRLDFSKDTGAANHFRGWNQAGSPGYITATSFTTSWQMDLTVTNTLGGLSGGDYATIGFQVTDSSSNYYAQMLSATSGGNFFRTEGNIGFSAVDSIAADNTDVFLRIGWDANAQTLNSFYSVDGSNYTLANSFNPVGTWNANVSDGFWFEVFGNSNLAGAIAPGAVYMDNFSVSAIPEPSTYAALAGLGALGLACWRRRQRRAAA